MPAELLRPHPVPLHRFLPPPIPSHPSLSPPPLPPFSCQGHPYAFVVAGETYLPGFMLSSHNLSVGDVIRGKRRAATTGRLPYRATAVDSVEHVGGADDRSGDDRDLDDANSDSGMPTGERRVGPGSVDSTGSEQSDDPNYDDDRPVDAQTAAHALFKYVVRHGGEIRLAAPPTVEGSLAHFYRQDPACSEVIKAWETPDSKQGVHAFARSHASMFGVVGRHPTQKVVIRGKGSGGAHGGAANGGGAAARGSSGGAARYDSSAQGSAGGYTNNGHHGQNNAQLVSRAAKAASQRAAARSVSQIDADTVRTELSELRFDIESATRALASAKSRMAQLEAALGDALETSSAA